MRQRYKAYITPTFNQDKVISTHSASFKKYIDWIFPQWMSYAKTGKRVPLQENFSQLILAISFEALFGLKEIPKDLNLIEVFNNLTYSAANIGDSTKSEKDIEMEKFMYMKSFITDMVKLFWEHEGERTEKTCFLDYLKQMILTLFLLRL